MKSSSNTVVDPSARGLIEWLKIKLVLRYTFYATLVSAVIFVCDIFYYRAGLGENMMLYYQLVRTADSDANGGGECSVPKIDPWDPSIRKYIDGNGKPLVCRHVQPNISALEFRTLEFTIPPGYTADSLVCWYRCVYKKTGDDFETSHSDWRLVKLKSGSRGPDASVVVNDCEFVEVYCSRSALQSVAVYHNLHAQVIASISLNSTNTSAVEELCQNATASPTDKKIRNRIRPRTYRKPDVMIFVIDSVSHANFLRQLPKSLKFLRSNLSSVVFDAYVKVADNTYPNALAILTGKRALVPNAKSELPEDTSSLHFDSWPLVWKNFSSAGYATLFAEDYPEFNIFTHHGLGFSDPPVDHYMRPFWTALWHSFVHKRSSHLCFGNIPKHVLQLNYLAQMWERYPACQPKFAVSWLVELSHDYLNLVSVGDDDIHDWLLRIRPHLDETILFFMSDHGHRRIPNMYGSRLRKISFNFVFNDSLIPVRGDNVCFSFDAIRESVIGRLEERMPFFSVAVPERIRRHYPRLWTNLLDNSNRLTSPFDVHATLNDILTFDWSSSTASDSDSLFAHQLSADAANCSDSILTTGAQLCNPDQKDVPPSRGLSLFRPISRDRSCADAGIPEEFCICQHEVTLNISDAYAQKAAAHLVDEVNRWLSRLTPPCAELTLSELRRAEAFLPNSKVISDPHISLFYRGDHPKGLFINYRVQVTVQPSGGILEATVRHDLFHGQYSLRGDINRVNRYGNQSACIHDPILEKYCFCSDDHL